MKFKTIRPFIMEFITFVFVAVCGSTLLIVCDFIEIHINKNSLLIGFLTIIFLFIISIFSRIINIAIRALIDYIFQKTKIGDYIFLKKDLYQASMFTEKYDRNHEKVTAIYYLIHARKNDKIYTFLSSYNLEMIEGKMYTIKAGKYSNILVSCELFNK